VTPPQPAKQIMMKESAKASKHAPGTHRDAGRFLRSAKGNIKTGTARPPADVEGRVSLRTTVTWYVPFGEAEVVAILT
jgi:hypothetical protein